jgi:hypothetical protein
MTSTVPECGRCRRPRRPQQVREIVDAAWRERQSVGARRQAAGVGDRAISSADLVPSRKELNICALKSPEADLRFAETVMAPHRVRRRLVIDRQVLGALARAHDLEA